MKKIRLLLIGDNRFLREGVIAMLNKQRDIKIVAASGKRENTVLKIHHLKPNVVLLDLGLRSLNSLHVVEIVRKEFPAAKVIVMDLAPVEGDIVQFVKAGAAGFILKDATLDDFLTTIRTVADGEKVRPPLLADSLFSQIVTYALKGGKKRLRGALRMTRPERKVVGLIGEGLSNKEIGRKIRISNHSIKSHLRNIMEKLALHSRLEVTNYSFAERSDKTIRRSRTRIGR